MLSRVRFVRRRAQRLSRFRHRRIADFVADQRAPTPTAAAELISPDVEQLRADIASRRSVFARALRRGLDNAWQRMDRAQRSLVSPQDRLARERDRFTQIAGTLRNAAMSRLDRGRFSTILLKQRVSARRPDLSLRFSALQQRRTRLSQSAQRAMFARTATVQGLEQAMQLLGPERVLERGYSIVEHEGTILRDSKKVRAGDTIDVRLARGRIAAVVK